MKAPLLANSIRRKGGYPGSYILREFYAQDKMFFSARIE